MEQLLKVPKDIGGTDDPARPSALPGAASNVGAAEEKETRASRPMSFVTQTLLLAYLLLLSLLLFYLLIFFWPGNEAPGAVGSETAKLFGVIQVEVSGQIRLILLVLVSGALGGLIHAFRSFAAFSGQRRLVASWAFWYVSRPFSAAILALLFYLLIAGGFLPDPKASGGAKPSIPAICGFAALMGLFSEQAVNKLREVVQTLLATSRSEKLGDHLSEKGGTPLLQSLAPTSVTAGQAALITLTGANFTSHTSVRVGGSELQPSFVDDQTLRLSLSAEILTGVSSLPVQVLSADGAQSAELVLAVSPPPDNTTVEEDG
ncbi:IPT/TIG domain-containing protein [Rhodovibrionaceae bacterium A322]